VEEIFADEGIVGEMKKEIGEERRGERKGKKGRRRKRGWEEDEGIEPAAVFFFFGG